MSPRYNEPPTAQEMQDPEPFICDECGDDKRDNDGLCEHERTAEREEFNRALDEVEDAIAAGDEELFADEDGSAAPKGGAA